MRPQIRETFTNIVKSDSDYLQYKGLVLSNGLKVLLISDKYCETSAAALGVGVGSMSEPDELPGLAHLLEHVLMLGDRQVLSLFSNGSDCRDCSCSLISPNSVGISAKAEALSTRSLLSITLSSHSTFPTNTSSTLLRSTTTDRKRDMNYVSINCQICSAFG